MNGESKITSTNINPGQNLYIDTTLCSKNVPQAKHYRVRVDTERKKIHIVTSPSTTLHRTVPQ